MSLAPSAAQPPATIDLQVASPFDPAGPADPPAARRPDPPPTRTAPDLAAPAPSAPAPDIAAIARAVQRRLSRSQALLRERRGGSR